MLSELFIVVFVVAAGDGGGGMCMCVCVPFFGGQNKSPSFGDMVKPLGQTNIEIFPTSETEV